MKMLTIHQPQPGRADDFCAGVEGEIAVPGMVCDRLDCGCDRSHSGLNSHAASSQLMVRELDLTPDDVAAACVGFLENAGWANLFDEPGELQDFARDVADDCAQAAAGYAVGTILRPAYDRARDEWHYSAVRASAGLVRSSQLTSTRSSSTSPSTRRATTTG